MYEVAAEHVGTTADALRTAVEGNCMYRTSIVTGFTNPISYFFGWNAFDRIPCDADFREYWLKSSALNHTTPHGQGADDSV